MHRPKVSIVLPVFNGEKYLNESLDSVLAQEHTDYELLICDDGSVDNTVKIIESKKDRRIRLFINKANQGLFQSLNMLIKESKGEYIRLWSYDDIMKPSCLGEEIRFYEKCREIGFCYCARDIIDNTGKIVIQAPKDKTPDVISPQLAAEVMFYHGSISGNIATVMIKKTVLEDIGLFREDMRQSGDFEMWVRISEKYPIGFIRQPLIKLRRHGRQYSRWKGEGLAFMRENQEVMVQLIKRLPPEIADYAKKYRLWHQSIQNTHYMFRSFLSGDFGIAKEAFKEICKITNPFFAISLWFVTVNNRFFKKKPKFLKTAC